ncbi:hypothetical protein [Streptomyces sp. NPDC048192]|uniref:hypothetical protein n=1 Tax=Streptomyces sp. NPDC048192 TaxID=3365510 RepID=UPI00371DEA37
MSHRRNRAQRTVGRLKAATVLAVLITLTSLALTVATHTAALPPPATSTATGPVTRSPRSPTPTAAPCA